MKRKKQLLTLIMALMLVFTSIPAVELFATQYDINGDGHWWFINGIESPAPTTLEVGDMIKDTTIREGLDLKIYYYQDEDAFNADWDTRTNASDQYVGLTKDDEHIVLGPEAVGVTAPPGKGFLHWEIQYVYGSSGYSTEIFLNPVWGDIYTVTYDANGGEGTVPTDNNEYLPGDVVTLLDGSMLSRPNYRFLGWSTDSAAIAPELECIIGTENTTLYAVWERIYTITYDANGGEGIPPTDNNEYLPGDVVTLLDGSMLSRPGYRFLGWSIDPIAIVPQSDYIMSVENRTLYAVWEKIYTVTYDANGGEGTLPIDNKEYLPGNVVSLLDGSMLSRPNYRFLGWSTNPSAIEPQSDCIIGTSNITLYAVWEEIPFVAPILTTPVAISIGSTKASLSALITPGTEVIEVQGFEWKKAGGDYTQVSTTGPNISISLTNLAPNTNYTVRTFAKANNILYYSDEKIFTTAQAPSSGNPGSNSGSSSESSSGGGSAAITYSIIVSETQGGTITPAGTIQVSKDADKTFTIKPDTGYKLSKILVDDKEVKLENENTYTFKGINSNHTLKAIFEKQYKALTKGTASFKIGENKYLSNNKEVIMDAVSYIQAPGYIMLPVRYVLEAFGIGEADIVYENETVTLFTDGKIIELTVGSEDSSVNGEKTKMGAKVINKEGRVYVPIGEIARALGVKTKWESKTKTAHFINE